MKDIRAALTADIESRMPKDEDQIRADKLKELELLGYTEEDLERSNPYNQWMYDE